MVDLFFVLSGVVFAYRYLDGWRMRADTGVSDFVVARIARLWPLHVVMTLIAAQLTIGDPATNWTNILLSLSMMQILTADPTATLNGPAWSLSVEFVCYAIFALAAVIGARTLRTVTVVAILAGAASIMWFGIWSALVGRGLLGFFCGVLLSSDLLYRHVERPLQKAMLRRFARPGAAASRMVV